MLPLDGEWLPPDDDWPPPEVPDPEEVFPPPLPPPVDSCPEPPAESPPELWPAADSRPLRTWWPALAPAPSRNASVNVCPEFLSALTPSSAPLLTVRPTSNPFWAPKLMFTDCAMTSEIMAWSAETAGSLAVSSAASRTCFAASLMIFRTIARVAAVAAATPISDRPNVNGAAAWAAMISAARIANWAITATFMPMTRPAATSRATAMVSAAVRASAKYPEPEPPLNFSQVVLKPSIESPEFWDTTLPAAVTPRCWSSSTPEAKFRHCWADSRNLSSSAVGQLNPSISRTHSSASGSINDTAGISRQARGQEEGVERKGLRRGTGRAARAGAPRGTAEGAAQGTP
ncbi:hypothetical protein AOB60_22995 [Streptomyces noursei]|uniref:Uncharacterized protein n=1 Tax=Streptomyces noursei TaxID=1971 RepID=A0A2N8P898_STRNR|nr:hypothetical protein AOB60_22995 [Streptomyces noursei]